MVNIDKIIQNLKDNKIEQAFELFNNLKKNEQIDFFKFLSKIFVKNSINISPKIISVLHRELNAEKTYQDFLNAWLPENSKKGFFYKFPAQVLNASSLENSNEIISIGFMDADSEEKILELHQQDQEIEKIRHEKIAKVAKKVGKTKIYTTLGVYTLGK